MADDEAQGQEDSSRPAFDAFTDSSLPSASFEPLVWPESRTWDEPPAREPEAEALLGAEHRDDLEGGLGLGGGAKAGASVNSRGAALEPLAESTSSAPGANGDIGLISTSALPAPPVHPAAERSSEGPRWRRFDIRQGNAAVVGLISLVSVVLLGMFLSVRARNQVPTDSSQSRRPGNQISVTGSLNTIPLTTTVTTTAPTAARVNIADLLAAVDAGAAPSGDATAADADGDARSGSGSPATTAAPSRSGGGPRGGGGSTTPATQPAAKAPAPTSPPATSPTVEDSTPEDMSPPPVDTTLAKRPMPTFTFPTFPTTTAPEDDGPSYTFPSRFDIKD